jgi:hypothetical protein
MSEYKLKNWYKKIGYLVEKVSEGFFSCQEKKSKVSTKKFYIVFVLFGCRAGAHLKFGFPRQLVQKQNSCADHSHFSGIPLFTKARRQIEIGLIIVDRSNKSLPFTNTIKMSIVCIYTESPNYKKNCSVPP